MSDEGQIKSIIERVQRLQEEKRTIEDDIKEVYAEARANGYDVKVLRAVVKHLGKNLEEVAEFDAIFDLYLQSYHAADKPSRAHAARDAGARTLEERSKDRLSEAMADNKDLSAEMLRDGLISPEAHAENVALSDAVATKLGSGVVSTEAPAAAEPPARKPYVLRPHCQRPDMCASYGSKHCGECERLANAAEDNDSADAPAFVRKTHNDIAMGEQA